jgi:hypothetical protein
MERDSRSGGVRIGSVGGSIANSTIAGRDVNAAPAAAVDDVGRELQEMRATLMALRPQIAAELGAVSPASTHLAEASAATLDDAAAKTSSDIDAPTAGEVKSKLDQVKSMLEMIVNGAVAIPTAVSKAEEGASGLLTKLTELATKAGALALTVGRLFG